MTCGKPRLRLFVAVAVVPLPLGLYAKQPDEVERIRSVGTMYLSSWLRGDYRAMHATLTDEARALMPIADFVRAFRIECPGSRTEKAALRRNWGLDYIITGRPSRILGVIGRQISPEQGAVQAVVEFTVGSETGIDAIFSHPDFFREFAKIRKGEDSTKALVMAMALEAVGAPTRYDTARGESKRLLGETGPPYVALYFREFRLIKQHGEWRIVNAIDVSEVPFASRPQKSRTAGLKSR